MMKYLHPFLIIEYVFFFFARPTFAFPFISLQSFDRFYCPEPYHPHTMGAIFGKVYNLLILHYVKSAE